MRDSGKASIALSPMVEFGGRLDLDPEIALRSYVAFGMSYLVESPEDDPIRLTREVVGERHF